MQHNSVVGLSATEYQKYNQIKKGLEIHGR